MKTYVAGGSPELIKALRALDPSVSVAPELSAIVGSAEPAVLIVDAAASHAEELIGSVPDDKPVPVVLATDAATLARATELVRLGADALIAMPAAKEMLDATIEVAVSARGRRVAQSTELHQTREQLIRFAADFRRSYEREVERTTALADSLFRLQSSYRDTVLSLAAAVEAKDVTTGRHLERVVATAAALTKVVDERLADDPYLPFGFLLHDVGKIGVPDQVLTKPGPLTDEEYAHMRRHAEIGSRIVGGIEFLKSVRSVIRHHHERWDGTGYPDGLKGHQIPKVARIFSVADAADAMLHDRPYRRALSLEQTREEVEAAAGSQFDPEIVEAFVELLEAKDSPYGSRAPDAGSR